MVTRGSAPRRKQFPRSQRGVVRRNPRPTSELSTKKELTSKPVESVEANPNPGFRREEGPVHDTRSDGAIKSAAQDTSQPSGQDEPSTLHDDARSTPPTRSEDGERAGDRSPGAEPGGGPGPTAAIGAVVGVGVSAISGFAATSNSTIVKTAGIVADAVVVAIGILAIRYRGRRK
jgi:hypothetical protein